MLCMCWLQLTIVAIPVDTNVDFLLVCHWDTILSLAAHEMCKLVQMPMSLAHLASGHQHCLRCYVRLCSVWRLPLAFDSWHLRHFPLLRTSRFCLVILTNISMKLFSLM